MRTYQQNQINYPQASSALWPFGSSASISKCCIYLFLLSAAIFAMLLAYNTTSARRATRPLAPDPYPVADTIRDTIRDTLIIKKLHYVPKVVYRDTGSTKVIVQEIDTQALIKDCLERHVIIDTLVDNERAFIVLTDTLWQNHIISRAPEIRLYSKVIQKTIFHPPERRTHLYLGLMVGGGGQQGTLGGVVTLQLRERQLLSLSYDPGNKTVGLAWGWGVF